MKELAALVLQDAELQRVVAVWPMVPREEVEACEPDADWDSMWGCVRFDERVLLELTGLPSGRGLVAIRRARALRLIYPDGAVNELARMVLQKQLKDALQPRKANRDA